MNTFPTARQLAVAQRPLALPQGKSASLEEAARIRPVPGIGRGTANLFKHVARHMPKANGCASYRCVLLSESEVLPWQWLNLQGSLIVSNAVNGARGGEFLHIPLDGSASLESIERSVIKAVVEKCGHNTTAAARLLGCTRETLRYRIQKYQIDSDESA